ncbi:unnamed protein product, partial [Rhizoctonia solani]
EDIKPAPLGIIASRLFRIVFTETALTLYLPLIDILNTLIVIFTRLRMFNSIVWMIGGRRCLVPDYSWTIARLYSIRISSSCRTMLAGWEKNKESGDRMICLAPHIRLFLLPPTTGGLRAWPHPLPPLYPPFPYPSYPFSVCGQSPTLWPLCGPTFFGAFGHTYRFSDVPKG